MKKLLISLAVLSISLSLMAQEHLTFKGIPIDGTKKSFIEKLEQKGFVLINNGGADITMLCGDFAGIANCTVGVSTMKDKDIVSNVAVIFPSIDLWYYLESNYDFLKETLTEKYGQPVKDKKEFLNGTPRDDKSKMRELQSQRCTYGAKYETPRGDIEILIFGDGVNGGYIIIRYMDKINSDIVRAAAKEDL